jgi:hypothetical protein
MTHLLFHKTPNSVSSEPGAAHAVDFTWRELCAVEKDLRFYDRGLDLIIGRGFGSVFSIIDRSRIKAGRHGRGYQPKPQHSPEPSTHHLAFSINR